MARGETHRWQALAAGCTAVQPYSAGGFERRVATPHLYGLGGRSWGPGVDAMGGRAERAAHLAWLSHACICPPSPRGGEARPVRVTCRRRDMQLHVCLTADAGDATGQTYCNTCVRSVDVRERRVFCGCDMYRLALYGRASLYVGCIY